MIVACFNMNGIRSAMQKGFADWMSQYQPDFLCVQETKAQIDALDPSIYCLDGYHCSFSSAEKKGYSGVGIYAKKEPSNIIHHCGLSWADQEGRYIAFEYDHLMIVSLYMPSGSSGDARQALKYEMMAHFYQTHLIQYLDLNKPVIICGDWNIAHKPIDIKNAKANQKNSGFLPEERAWLDEVLTLGYVDAFRTVCVDPEQYTWWSYRARAREKNVGWRIDYQITTPDLKDKIKSTHIFPTPIYSDHAPFIVEYNI